MLPQKTNGEDASVASAIEESCTRLHALYKTACDKNFDKFEVYLKRNILSVPEGLAELVRFLFLQSL